MQVQVPTSRQKQSSETLTAFELSKRSSLLSKVSPWLCDFLAKKKRENVIELPSFGDQSDEYIREFHRGFSPDSGRSRNFSSSCSSISSSSSGGGTKEDEGDDDNYHANVGSSSRGVTNELKADKIEVAIRPECKYIMVESLPVR